MNGVLQGAYKNIDIAVQAGSKFIMDTKAHLEKTSNYNIGEVALASYLSSKGYVREDSTGIWRKSQQTNFEQETGESSTECFI